MRSSKIALHTALISACVTLIAAIIYVATISRGMTISSRPSVLAAAFTLFGALPPLWFGRKFSNAAARQLGVVAWRMATMLPAVLMVSRFEGEERNCFLRTLLACYFVALVLESGLLIREAHRESDSAHE